MAVSRRLLSALSVLCLALCGCGGGGGKLQAVSGTVQFKQEPLDQGMIQFFAREGLAGPAGGAPIRAGKYALPRDHGLEPGVYWVVITSPEIQGTYTAEDYRKGAPLPKHNERIPPEFNYQTNVTVEVQSGGKNKFDFTIP